jgi:hypothetical protein
MSSRSAACVIGWLTVLATHQMSHLVQMVNVFGSSDEWRPLTCLRLGCSAHGITCVGCSSGRMGDGATTPAPSAPTCPLLRVVLSGYPSVDSSVPCRPPAVCPVSRRSRAVVARSSEGLDCARHRRFVEKRMLATSVAYATAVVADFLLLVVHDYTQSRCAAYAA